MKVWMIDIASTDGYMCTEGPFVSAEYVLTSPYWTFHEMKWNKVEDERYYAEVKDGSVISGYVLYSVHVEGT